MMDVKDDHFHLPLQVPYAFEEHTDIYLKVKAGAASEVTGGFEGYIIKH